MRLISDHEQRSGERGKSEPEFRLPPAMLGSVLTPIGLFWYVMHRVSYDGLLNRVPAGSRGPLTLRYM